MANRTVLLVDDTAEIRRVYKTYLQNSGFSVVEAVDGGEAVRLAFERRPAAILMDLGLPGLDGWGAIDALRDDPATARIPVIVLTALDDPANRERAAASGCAAFLTKPCGGERLTSLVAQVIDPEGQRKQDVTISDAAPRRSPQ